MTKTLALAAGSVLALSLGAGIASASVSAADLQQMISSEIGSQGAPPDSVVCPEDVASDVGASVTCAVTTGDETRGVTVSVVSVDDGQPQLSMTLARQ